MTLLRIGPALGFGEGLSSAGRSPSGTPQIGVGLGWGPW